MNAADPISGEGLWPTETQLLLIKASLWKGEVARNAWQEWLQRIDLDGDLDPITFRLLPLLYCNMQNLGEKDQVMHRLKGLYRNAWYRNNLLFHGLMPLFRDLHDSGFRLLFLKGLPLSVNYYPKSGSRPMSDVDVLVPIEQAESVVAFMDERGYRRHWTSQDGGTAYRHSISYQYKGHEIDIHWHLLRDCCDPALTDEIWKTAEPFEYRGLPGWTLSPVDMLFHQLLHGLRWNPEPSVRWIPDAYTVISQHEKNIDWSRLVQLGQKYSFCERCHLALRFLHEELGATVPAAVFRDLAKGGKTLVERMERTFVLQNHSAMYAHPLGKLWITFVDYQSQGKRRKLIPHCFGFSHFVRIRWRVRGRRELLQSTFAGLWRRLLGRLSSRTSS